MSLRLLTFNCHEAYVHCLAKLDATFDIVDGLPGRSSSRWNLGARPVPDNGRLIGLHDTRRPRTPYHAVIAHNVSDLLAVKHLDAPKVLVLHGSLTARLQNERCSDSPREMRDQLLEYLELVGGTVVAVSEMKRDSWLLDCEVVAPTADPDDYSGYVGDLARGLRVANQVDDRRETLDWSAHERITSGLPMVLLGHNPGRAEARGSKSWDDLKDAYRRQRFLVHTAKPGLEDGYNLATLEAMCTGMPVVTTAHPSTPIVDGENGYVSADLERLHRDAERLLADRRLARRLGLAARETVLQRFGVGAFVGRWESVIEGAIKKWSDSRPQRPAPRRTSPARA